MDLDKPLGLSRFQVLLLVRNDILEVRIKSNQKLMSKKDNQQSETRELLIALQPKI